MDTRSTFSFCMGSFLAGLLLVSGCGNSKKEGAEAPISGTVSPTGNIQASIQSVVISSPTSTPVVTLTLLDEKGAPLDPNAIVAAGGRFRLYIAQLAPDANGDYQYKNYLKSATNLPTYDSGGTVAALGNGVYQYTFKTNITDSTKTLNNLVYDPALTHTIAAQISRTVVSPTGSSFTQVANPFLTFVPDGSVVTHTREITPISACNDCHGKLALHGGTRIDVALCILCHNPGVLDPDTGNSVDMKSLIHKIHMGEKLPSNVAGGEYGIGNASFKTVAYPMMSRDTFVSLTPADCAKCHKMGKDATGRAYGRDADKWKTGPTRDKCTTCHDLTSFDSAVTTMTVTIVTGPATTVLPAVQHAGGNQANDSNCATCHPSTGLNDYSDLSSGPSGTAPVPSAHLILEKSDIFTGLNYQIVAVTSAVTGTTPTVIFRITDNAGNPLNPAASGSSYSLKFGYFTQADYSGTDMVYGSNTTGQPISQSLAGATANGDGTYTIVFSTPIPTTAVGTGVIGMEGRATYAFSTPHKGAQSRTIGGNSVQYYFDLATGVRVVDAAKQRRKVVDVEKCNACHFRLSLHGANRTNSVQQCVICHNPNAVWTTTAPLPSPIDFKYFIHFIHTGENLDVNRTYYDAGFTEVRYPRDRRDCSACHLETAPNTYGLPLPAGVLGTTISMGTSTLSDSDNTRIPAMKAVCTSCHDSLLAIGHADGKVVSGAETCVSCHMSGLLLSPENAHLPVR